MENGLNIENKVHYIEEKDLNVFVESLNGDNALEDAETAADTIASLGGTDDVFGFQPPSIGMLAMLDAIESPFVTASLERVGVPEILKTLYVMCYGREALNPIYASLKRERLIRKAESMAEKSPEYYAEYLKAVDRLADGWAEFDKAVIEYAEKLGNIDVDDTVKNINEYLGECFGGFSMLPQDDDG